jgi:hypothetical protein
VSGVVIGISVALLAVDRVGKARAGARAGKRRRVRRRHRFHAAESIAGEIAVVYTIALRVRGARP